MLTVFIDFKSPASYLALEPTIQLADKYACPITWLPFSTAERDIPSEGTNPDLAASHAAVRANSIKRIHQRYAELRGIEMIYPAEQLPTDLALGTLGATKGNPIDFIRGAFKHYWVESGSLDDFETVRTLMEKCLAESPPLEKQLRKNLREQQEKAEALGVVDAPTYLIDGQLFLGREHLPWVESILQNKYETG